MADTNPTAPDADSAPTKAEKQALSDEALVLDRLLIHHPAHLQESDLERELQLGDDKFERRDRIERAVDQLHWAGLALRCGPVVMLARPALQYHLLSEQTTVDL
jgi:hypothetical protein